MPAEVVDERSRALLVGELDSVLRARPLPPTFERHLPFEGGQPLEEGGGSEEGEGSETSGEQNAEPYLHVPAPLMTPTVPIAENAFSQDLVSELRAQLSMAANEEIFFSSNRHQATLSSDGEGDSMLVGHEEEQNDRARSDVARETG